MAAGSAAAAEVEQAVGPTTTMAAASSAMSSGGKKKRGRPRKYAPDGSSTKPLNPVPISASAPPTVIDYGPVATQQSPVAATTAAAGNSGAKRGRGRPVGYSAPPPPQGVEVEEVLGDMVACSAGANFTPHIINVATGEDVTMKIMSLSQQGPGAICILSANGSISNVTLRQSDSFGGTLTHEGRFEILSLSGSFMPKEDGGTKSRSGGMSISLASPDGRVVGGGVAGLLIAASPVQVVVGTFVPSYQMEQMNKKPKPRPETVISFQTPVTTSTSDKVYGSSQGLNVLPMANTVNATSYTTDAWPTPTDSRNYLDDINVSLPMG